MATGDSQIDGDLYAQGQVNLDDDSRVEGTIHAGGTIYVQPTAYAGGEEEFADTIEPCMCGFDLQAALDDAQLNNDNDVLDDLVPGWGGWLLLLDGETVTLPAGRYYIPWLGLENGATLKPADEGVVDLFVEHTWIETGSTLGNATRGPDALNFVSGAWVGNGTALYVTGGSRLFGHVVEPVGAMHIYDDSEIHGTVTGFHIDLDEGGSIFIPDSVTGVPACE